MMAKFFWKGLDTHGATQRGTLYATSPDQLKEDLLSQDIALLDYYTRSHKLFFLRHIFQEKITDEQLLVFFEHMTMLINCGVSIPQSIRLFVKQTSNARLKDILHHIIEHIEKGHSFSLSLQQHPSVFSTFIVELVHAGEKSGNLGLVLTKISTHLHEQLTFKKELLQAALLPFITFSAAIIMLLGILIFIIPQFELIFNSMGKPLPPSTQMVITISRFLRSGHGIILLIGFLLPYGILKKYAHNPGIKRLKDRLALSLPFKKLYINAILINFLQTLAMFIKSGIPLKQALEGAQSATSNSIFSTKITLLIDYITQGKSLEYALQNTDPMYFSENLTALVAIGEQSGNLAPMLDQATSLLQLELKKKINFITTMLQPCLLIVIGITITGIMIAVYLPIFTLAATI